LVPAKTGFAFKVGQAAFEAGRCDKAEEYLAHFRQYGEPDKHAEMMAQADGMLNRLETMGCAEQQAPPPVERRGSCAVTDTNPSTPSLAMLLLLGLGLRRPRRRQLTWRARSRSPSRPSRCAGASEDQG